MASPVGRLPCSINSAPAEAAALAAVGSEVLAARPALP